VSAKRDKGQLTGVTWRGRLAAKDADQFGLFVKLPAKPGSLYFPTLQQCEKGEIRWSDIPAAGQAPRNVPHPAPVLQLIAAAQPANVDAALPVDDIMIEQPGPRRPRRADRSLYDHHHPARPPTHCWAAASPLGKLDIHQMSMANGAMSMPCFGRRNIRREAPSLSIPKPAIISC
jgi:hypothetical protein